MTIRERILSKPTSNGDDCTLAMCQHTAGIRYMGRPLCERHWVALCDELDKTMELSIEPFDAVGFFSTTEGGA